MHYRFFDSLSIPNYVIKQGPSHGAPHGNTERQRIYHAARQIKRDLKLYWLDFKIVHFTERHRSRFDGTKNSARYDAIAKEDHTYVATAEER